MKASENSKVNWNASQSINSSDRTLLNGDIVSGVKYKHSITSLSGNESEQDGNRPPLANGSSNRVLPSIDAEHLPEYREASGQRISTQSRPLSSSDHSESLASASASSYLTYLMSPEHDQWLTQLFGRDVRLKTWPKGNQDETKD